MGLDRTDVALLLSLERYLLLSHIVVWKRRVSLEAMILLDFLVFVLTYSFLLTSVLFEIFRRVPAENGYVLVPRIDGLSYGLGTTDFC